MKKHKNVLVLGFAHLTVIEHISNMLDPGYLVLSFEIATRVSALQIQSQGDDLDLCSQGHKQKFCDLL